MEGWMGLSMNHVISRSVRDSAHLLDLTQGREPGSRTVPPRDVEGSYLDALKQPPKKLRIAVWSKNYFGIPVHADCQAAVDKAIKACLALGHEIVEDMPELPVAEVFSGLGVVTSVGMMASIRAREKLLGRAVRQDELEQMDWLYLEKAKSYTAEQMLMARTNFDTAGQILDRFFLKYDLILTPVMAVPPPLLGVLTLDQPYDSFAREAVKASPYTALFNMTGQPAMSVPMHWTRDNLPVGRTSLRRLAAKAACWRWPRSWSKPLPGHIVSLICRFSKRNFKKADGHEPVCIASKRGKKWVFATREPSSSPVQAVAWAALMRWPSRKKVQMW
jgi:amidase/aspartyl-tRNA(Asn)/glutamyl-tRNA(Gln) amidotransferase subunit A